MPNISISYSLIEDFYMSVDEVRVFEIIDFVQFNNKGTKEITKILLGF